MAITKELIGWAIISGSCGAMFGAVIMAVIFAAKERKNGNVK